MHECTAAVWDSGRLVAGLPFGQVGAVGLHSLRHRRLQSWVLSVLGEFSVTGHLCDCSAGGLWAAENFACSVKLFSFQI